MRKIEQTKENMTEIYQKLIYPGFSCAAMVDVQIQKIEALRDSLTTEGSNKELNRVMTYELNKVIKDLKTVRDIMNTTMGDALIGFAPAEFVVELQNKIIGGESK